MKIYCQITLELFINHNCLVVCQKLSDETRCQWRISDTISVVVAGRPTVQVTCEEGMESSCET